MKKLITRFETSSREVVLGLHAAGHVVTLESKGPIRWTYVTSASARDVAAAMGAARTGGSYSPIPEGSLELAYAQDGN